ncbi:MAG: ABC transporter substrate-binding protein [Isosphaeraceae bacterium]
MVHAPAHQRAILGLGAGMLIVGVLFSPVLGRPQQPAAPGVDLLRSVPFDRLTLVDGSVLLVEPVSPRPLPPLDPKRTRKGETVKLKGSGTEIPLEGNIGLPGEPSKFKSREQRKADDAEDESDRSIKIHLLQEAEVRDFSVKRSSIRSIEYFEEMLINESARLSLAQDFGRAFECLLRVKSRNPSWPGLDEQVNRFLFAEGSAALIGGDSERGLRLLRELLGRKRDFPGLLDRLADAYKGWIARAMELGQFSTGRRFLHELAEMAPEHPVVRDLRGRFESRAGERVKQSESLAGPDRLDALVEAVRVWPELEGLKQRYARAFEEFPTLEVGVGDIAHPLGPWVRSPADARLSRLLYRPILADDGDAARQGKAPDQLAAGLESTDLGRRLLIRLQAGIPWSDGSRQVGAADVARALIDRCDPNSPRYQARWADLLDRVEAAEESRVEVRLKRPLVKAGVWLDRPVGPAHAGIDGRIATAGSERPLVTDGPYGCRSSSEQATELVLNEGSAAGGSPAGPRVRRIRERRFPGPRGLVGALVQGEVSLLAHVPADQVAGLRNEPEIRVGRYAAPSVHLIALDGRNPALRNRSLRRGLSYAVDRATILGETILKHPVDEGNSVADGPFPRGSYADAPGVKPLEHNAALATMLVAAARKELGGSPIELKFEYPEIPEAIAAAPVIAEAFRSAGLKVEAIARPETALESELKAGRRFDLAYRVVRVEEPILDAGPLLCPAYDARPEADGLTSAVSPRILQLLLQLERAVDVSTARGLAIQVDRESRDELPVLPLWHVVDHYAWRSRLKGPGETAQRLYQGIESWEIVPWIPSDPWSKKP